MPDKVSSATKVLRPRINASSCHARFCHRRILCDGQCRRVVAADTLQWVAVAVRGRFRRSDNINILRRLNGQQRRRHYHPDTVALTTLLAVVAPFVGDSFTAAGVGHALAKVRLRVVSMQTIVEPALVATVCPPDIRAHCTAHPWPAACIGLLYCVGRRSLRPRLSRPYCSSRQHRVCILWHSGRLLCGSDQEQRLPRQYLASHSGRRVSGGERLPHLREQHRFW